MQSTIPFYGFGSGRSGGTAVLKYLPNGLWAVTIQSGSHTAWDTVQIQTNFSKAMAFSQCA